VDVDVRVGVVGYRRVLGTRAGVFFSLTRSNDRAFTTDPHALSHPHPHPPLHPHPYPHPPAHTLTFPVDVPYDLRKHLQLPKSIVGYYAGSATEAMGRLRLRTTKFWSLAAQSMGQTMKSLNDGSVYFNIHYLDKLVNSSKLFY